MGPGVTYGGQLTNQNPYAKLSLSHTKKPLLHTYIYRASWDATGKTIKVRAPNEDKAREKAEKRKDIRGSIRLAYLGSY